jgi:hypothetical protein
MVAGHLAPIFGAGIEKSLIESKQGQGQLPIAEVRQLHMAGLIFAAGICFWSIITRKQELPSRFVALHAFVLSGIVWNAIVTGALSGPYDRYLARVIWLVCFVALVAFCLVVRIRQSKQDSSERTEHSSAQTAAQPPQNLWRLWRSCSRQ